MKDNATYVLIISSACIAVISLALFLAPRVEAAAPDVPECEPINTTGAIVVYRCLPNEGPSYLLNSFGFMLFED